MGYVISGTTVNSVDYTDFPFGGVGGNGTALSKAPAGWISYTFARPDVRTAPDGKDYFIVKNVSFRCSAAPLDSAGKTGTPYKMYGRVSWADGSEYANSYQPPNSISWQKAPTVTYTFQGTKFAVAQGSNGTTIRVWLVSGGPFLFQRNPGAPGHVVGSNGSTYAGAPAGYLTVAQIASAPKNLTVVRGATATQQVTVKWQPPDHLGGTGSGYHLEVAEDAGFTTGVREYYPAIKSGAALTYVSTGYSESKQYFFRIAARNEVSEYFKLKGGQWSNVASVDVAPADTSAPPADTGIPGGTSGTGSNGTGGSTTTSPGGADGSSGSSGGASGTVVTGGGTGSTVGGTPDDDGDTSGDSPTTGTSGSTGSSGSSSSGSTPTTGAGGTVVYTPIPDTSPDRSKKGGLLRSKQPKSTRTRAFVYDRGGKRRLGELYELSQIKWGRVRDDISQATITMTPQAAERNIAVLRRMGVCRSELVIFRGDQRVWEGPIDRFTPKRSGVEIHAQDVLWYATRTAMRHAYSNAYPNVGYTVDRIAGILTVEMSRLETPKFHADGSVAVPGINVLDYLHTYVEDGDTRTSQVTDAYASSVWTHLDDLASNGGIDYTVVGRAIHIWDTSRAALGRTRTVNEQDFLGDPYITQYGSELATVYSVTDGQGDFASLFNQVELDDPYYGELEQIATAYGATSTTTTTNTDGSVTETTTSETVSFEDMTDQAKRGALGRDPVPWALHVPDGSSIDIARSGLGIDVMIPGVYVPVLGTFSSFTFATVQKIASVDVTVTSSRSGVTESVAVTMEPASDDDAAAAAEDDDS